MILVFASISAKISFLFFAWNLPLPLPRPTQKRLAFRIDSPKLSIDFILVAIILTEHFSHKGFELAYSPRGQVCFLYGIHDLHDCVCNLFKTLDYFITC